MISPCAPLCLLAAAAWVSAPPLSPPFSPSPPLPAPPWVESGHRVIATWTWAELQPATRTRLAALLKEHPRYREDLLAGLPAGSGAEAEARHAFALASIWPDVIKDVAHPLRRTENRPHWHYVDLPYVLDGQPLPERRPPAGDGPHDVLSAIAKCAADLGDPAVAADRRAIALCWTAHLVADLHQPLHACTLYSPQFPQGDKGGNAFLVLRDVRFRDSATNLHLLWDSLLGSYRAYELDACVATGLAARPELARKALADAVAVRDPKAWADESHALAIEHAYLHGELIGVAAPKDGEQGQAKEPPQPQPVPRDYLANAERVAMRRAALAAYRLADLLDGTFAGKQAAR